MSSSEDNSADHTSCCSDPAERPASIGSSNRTSTRTSIDSATQTDHIRPPYSYIALIVMAINSREDRKISVREIYRFIESRFPYYRKNKQAWQNGIRHNLSLNSCFQKVNRQDWDQTEEKGHLWTIASGHEDMFDGGNYRRRKRTIVRRVSESRANWPSLRVNIQDPSREAVEDIEENVSSLEVEVRDLRKLQPALADRGKQLTNLSFSVDSLISHQARDSAGILALHDKNSGNITTNSSFLNSPLNLKTPLDHGCLESGSAFLRFRQLNDIFFTQNRQDNSLQIYDVLSSNYPSFFSSFSIPLSAVFDFSRPLK